MEDKGAASEKARMSSVYKSLQETSVAAMRGTWGAVAGDKMRGESGGQITQLLSHQKRESDSRL